MNSYKIRQLRQSQRLYRYSHMKRMIHRGLFQLLMRPFFKAWHQYIFQVMPTIVGKYERLTMRRWHLKDMQDLALVEVLRNPKMKPRFYAGAWLTRIFTAPLLNRIRTTLGF